MAPTGKIEVGYNGNVYSFTTEGNYCLVPENVGKLDIARGSSEYEKSPRIYLTFGTQYDSDRVIELVMDYKNFLRADDILNDLDEIPLDDLINENNQIIAAHGDGLVADAVEIVLHHLYHYFGHLNFVDLNKITSRNMTTQMKVTDDFFIGKLNLKDREFKVVKQMQDRQGKIYVVGDFNEDINGSSLDGTLPTRSCAIIPQEKVRKISKGGDREENKFKVRGKVINSKII